MDTLRDLEVVRAVGGCVRAQRAEGDAEGMPTMEVRFSPFGEWYEINSFWEGKFLERTVKGAFAKTISENLRNVKVLFNHGFDPQIGDKVLGPIDDLREEAKSPVGVVPLLDTSYNRDLVPGLEAGVYGSSFRFQVIRDEWNDEPGVSDHNPAGIPERTIKEVRLFEFGPVTFPANPAATSGVRSLTDDYYERLRSRDPQRVDDLAVRARRLRTPDESAAREGTDSDSAAATPEEPARSHSEDAHLSRSKQWRDRYFGLTHTSEGD